MCNIDAPEGLCKRRSHLESRIVVDDGTRVVAEFAAVQGTVIFGTETVSTNLSFWETFISGKSFAGDFPYQLYSM